MIYISERGTKTQSKTPGQPKEFKDKENEDQIVIAKAAICRMRRLSMNRLLTWFVFAVHREFSIFYPSSLEELPCENLNRGQKKGKWIKEEGCPKT